MTNKEAIEIVNNSIILNKDEFYPDELEAFKRLIQTAKDWDALMNMTCVKISKEDEEKIIDKLNEVGNVGYIMSADDYEKAMVYGEIC